MILSARAWRLEMMGGMGILLAFWTHPALGGETAPRPTPPPRFVNPEPLSSRPTFRPRRAAPQSEGIKLGDVTLLPSHEQTFTFDDNVLGQSARTEQRDFLLEYHPGMALEYAPSKHFRLESSYEFGWHDYLDDNARDFLTHRAHLDLEARHVGVKGLSLGLREDYSQTGQTDVLDNQFPSFRRLQGNQLSPRVSFHLNRLGFQARYRFGVVDYFSRRDAELDDHTQRADAQFFYRLTDRNLLAFVRYTFGGTRFSNIGGLDFDTHAVRAGLSGTWRKFRFRASVGRRNVLGRGPGGARSGLIARHEAEAGPVARLSVEYEAHDKTLLFLRARRAFTAQTLTGNATELDFAIGGRWSLPEHFRLEARASWFQEDRRSGEVQRTLNYSVELRRKIIKRLRVKLFFIRSQQTSNRALDITINRAGAGLVFRF